MYSSIKLTYWVDVFNTEKADFETINVSKEYDLIFLIKSSKNTQDLLLSDGFDDIEIPEHCIESNRGMNIDDFTINKENEDYDFIKTFLDSCNDLRQHFTVSLIPLMRGISSHIYKLEEGEDIDDA